MRNEKKGNGITMSKNKAFMLVCLFVLVLTLSGCKNQSQGKGAHSKTSIWNNDKGNQSLTKNDVNQADGTLYEEQEENSDAYYNDESNKENPQEEGAEENVPSTDLTYETKYDNAVTKNKSIYDCDIKADQESFNGEVDIVVGDTMYSTQINDWYMNFEQYEGKVVEIEGYYINDFAPYDFIGRYGPDCPYCQGGYISFEFVTNEDLSSYVSVKDWIKVTGVLREGFDKEFGPFYYIEVLQLEKMSKVGKDTVTN